MKARIYILLAIILLCINFLHAGPIPYLDSLFEYNYRRFEKQFYQNELNKSLGRKEENNYVFVFDEKYDRPWAGVLTSYKKPFNLSKEGIQLFEDINDQLADFNNDPAINPKNIEIYNVLVFVESINWSDLINVQKLKSTSAILEYLEEETKSGNDDYLKIIKEQFQDYVTQLNGRIYDLISKNSYLNKSPFSKSDRIIIDVGSLYCTYKDPISITKRPQVFTIFDWAYSANIFSENEVTLIQANLNSTQNNYPRSTAGIASWYTTEIIKSLKGISSGDLVLNDFDFKNEWNDAIPDEEIFRQRYDATADRFARAVESAFIARKSMGEYQYTQSHPTAQFVTISNQADPVTINNKNIFDDQLAYLFENDKTFFVIVSDTCHIEMQPIQWSGFSSLVMSKIDRNKIDADYKLVIITIPYLEKYPKNLLMPGVAFDANTVDKERMRADYIKQEYINELVQIVFKYTEKEVTEFTCLLFADGTRDTISTIYHGKEGVGKEYNSIIKAFKNKYFDEISNLPVPQETNRDIKDDNNIGKINPNYFAEMVAYELKRNELLQQAQEQGDKEENWNEVEVKVSIIEKYQQELLYDYLHHYVFNEGITAWLKHTSIYTINENERLDDGHLKLSSSYQYNDNIWKILVDPAIYTIINVAGIIPGADFIPDLVGMTYATLRGDVNKAGEYVLGVAIVGVSTGVLVLGSKMIGKTVNTIAHRGRQLSINASNRLESVLLPRFRPQIATSEIFNLEFARHADISPGFIKFAQEKKFSSHQLKTIAKGEAAETERKLAQMRVLEREGTDVFHTLRGKTFDKLEDLADGLTDFEQRKVFSSALKEMDDITLGKLNKDLENEAFKNYLAGNAEGVRAWKRLISSPGLRKSISSLELVGKWIDEGLVISFEFIEDGAKVFNKNNDEIGQLIKNDIEEYFEISDDFFVDSGSPISFGSITIKSNTGENFINPRYVKNSDGTIGFIEDVGTYGNQLIQNAIKQRGKLRRLLIDIKKTEDAHHIIPIQLLKENQVVQKAMEGGFEFNSITNGIPVEKFVKATNKGRHGPHPNYTSQIQQYLNDWASQNKGYTADAAKQELTDMVNAIRIKINTTTAKINELPLGL